MMHLKHIYKTYFFFLLLLTSLEVNSQTAGANHILDGAADNGKVTLGNTVTLAEGTLASGSIFIAGNKNTRAGDKLDQVCEPLRSIECEPKYNKLKDGVVFCSMSSDQGVSSFSASIINSTDNNGKLLILTAGHNVLLKNDNGNKTFRFSSIDLENTSIYLNYYATCDNSNEEEVVPSEDSKMTGLRFLDGRYGVDSNDELMDWALLEVINPMPNICSVSYLGWDASSDFLSYTSKSIVIGHPGNYPATIGIENDGFFINSSDFVVTLYGQVVVDFDSKMFAQGISGSPIIQVENNLGSSINLVGGILVSSADTRLFQELPFCERSIYEPTSTNLGFTSSELEYHQFAQILPLSSFDWTLLQPHLDPNNILEGKKKKWFGSIRKEDLLTQLDVDENDINISLGRDLIIENLLYDVNTEPINQTLPVQVPVTALQETKILSGKTVTIRGNVKFKPSRLKSITIKTNTDLFADDCPPEN